MNSDPYDSAAWRAFGMLDADESALFDEAMRHDPVLRDALLEMDRLSAAVAVAATRPVAPQPWRLDQLRSRLGLGPARRSGIWWAVSGWAAAAALALILVFANPSNDARVARKSTPAPPPLPAVPGVVTAAASADVPGENPGAIPPADHAPPPPSIAGTTSAESKPASRAETRRLVQEIEVLREDLARFQQRDRILFEAVPGMALPIIVKMNPPGVFDDENDDLISSGGYSPVAALLADERRAAAANPDPNSAVNADDSATTPSAAAPPDAGDGPADGEAFAPPTAIPIYDSARDNGTIVVNNLPPAPPDGIYNLWVQTAAGGGPIFVGSLPEMTGDNAESFDFSLGSNMVLPTRFILTLDTSGHPASPEESNIILEGPPPRR